MNIYEITEDGETFCVRSETMAAAVYVCLSSYIRREELSSDEEFNEKAEAEFYHNNILQSCKLIGELKN